MGERGEERHDGCEVKRGMMDVREVKRGMMGVRGEEGHDGCER